MKRFFTAVSGASFGYVVTYFTSDIIVGTFVVLGVMSFLWALDLIINPK